MCDNDFFGDDFEDNIFDANDDYQEDLIDDVQDEFTTNFDEETIVAREEAEEAAVNQIEVLIIGSMIVGLAIEEASDRKHYQKKSKKK